MSLQVAIMAAEPSGDLQAGALARALRQRRPGIRLWGVGGECLRAAGVSLICDSQTWSTIGPTEALGKLPGIYRAYRRLRGELLRRRPDLVVVIDAPAIHMRLAGFNRRHGLRTVYYFPPSAWTSSRRRLEQIHSRVDAVVAAFRYNAENYRRAGLPVVYYGHPLVDLCPRPESRAAVLESLGLEEGQWASLLPGSRTQEIRLNTPLLLEAARRLRRDRPGLRFLMPCASAPLEERLRRLPLPPWVTLLSGRAREALALSRVAVMASGSASLEAALLGVPHVLFYRLSRLDAALGWALLRTGLLQVDRFGLPNLILQEDAVVELLQGEATPERLAQEAGKLLEECEERRRHLLALERVRRELGGPGAVARVAAFVDHFAAGCSREEACAAVEEELGGRRLHR